MDRVVALLTDDAWVTMPPEPYEYQGHAAIRDFLEHVVARRTTGGKTLLVATRANGQPAFGHYMLEPGEAAAAGRGVLALTLDGDRISMITRFAGAHLLPSFGLPPRLTDRGLGTNGGPVPEPTHIGPDPA